MAIIKIDDDTVSISREPEIRTNSSLLREKTMLENNIAKVPEWQARIDLMDAAIEVLK